MQISAPVKKFFKKSSYLLLSSLLLILCSFVFQLTGEFKSSEKIFSASLQEYIHTGEKQFAKFCDQSVLRGKTDSPDFSEEDFADDKQFFFVYSNTQGFRQLLFWNTQTILPAEEIIRSSAQSGFTALSNGEYVWLKKNAGRFEVISLLPVKYNYYISNDYLVNSYAIARRGDLKFDLSAFRGTCAVKTNNGKTLFFVSAKEKIPSQSPQISFYLKIAAVIPLLLFLHFAAMFLHRRKGLLHASIFLGGSIFFLRLITYLFPLPVNLRRFELFDPAIYGADPVLRSLGDLLINTILFFWLINFMRLRLKGKIVLIPAGAQKFRNFILAGSAFILLFVTYIGSAVVRSLIADSQISFDVLHFFTLNIYSVVGFLILSCIAVGYFYFCRIVLYFLREVMPTFLLPLVLLISAGGLFILSFRIGSINGGFELYALIWLLLFLLLLKQDLRGFFAKETLISKPVFWLFFFSVSITSVIITENTGKELRNRQHFAEVIAEKTDPVTEVLINTMTTEFRPDMLAANFSKLEDEAANRKFKDSLINNNFAGYTDNFATNILVFDSLNAPLFNEDRTDYNSVNSIFSTQTRPATVPGLLIYDDGPDRVNYISRKIITDYGGHFLGTVFILIHSRENEYETLYPELFGRGHGNSRENSYEYAYAVYDKGRLTETHNDYAFFSGNPDTYFPNNQYLLLNRNQYSELWYKSAADKYVVVVKENRRIIESVTLFSYLFCSFLLLTALSRLISFFLKTRLRFTAMRNLIRLSIQQQIHGTIIFFIVSSFLIIGIATILFFIDRYESNNRETLSRTGATIKNELRKTLSARAVQAAVFPVISEDSFDVNLSSVIRNTAAVHGIDLNLYTTGGDLKASSLPLPYEKGILSTKMNPLAWFRLNKKHEIRFLQKEKIGKLSYVSDYIPLTDTQGSDIAYLNIPFFTSQTRLEQEISNFLVTIINLNAFIFLVAGILALLITHRITATFTLIGEKMKRINLGRLNEKLVWKRNDEIGALVKEYNRMLGKLDASAAALAKSERESAWQEMAMQVAHEIKNPLTPMKLSMQFLQRAVQANSPDIKQLADKVSKTLVEQIDHLSTIAGEFSRFATIGSAHPEDFDLNEILRSLQLLYSGDPRATISWNLISSPVIIHADRTHINRLFTNLILNGIQAVPDERHAMLQIHETIAENYVIVSVKDNGSGIPDEIREKIFTPNFTTKSSGTGLGLAMCMRMASQAGGLITFETSPEGTVFVTTLPMAKINSA